MRFTPIRRTITIIQIANERVNIITQKASARSIRLSCSIEIAGVRINITNRPAIYKDGAREQRMCECLAELDPLIKFERRLMQHESDGKSRDFGSSGFGSCTPCHCGLSVREPANRFWDSAYSVWIFKSP